MLPCLSKQFFGLDCPGCGLQRSAMLVLEGHFGAAFTMFPAIYTTIFLFGWIGFDMLYKRNMSKGIIPLAVINGAIILFSYLFKIYYLTL